MLYISDVNIISILYVRKLRFAKKIILVSGRVRIQILDIWCQRTCLSYEPWQVQAFVLVSGIFSDCA